MKAVLHQSHIPPFTEVYSLPVLLTTECVSVRQLSSCVWDQSAPCPWFPLELPRKCLMTRWTSSQQWLVKSGKNVPPEVNDIQKLNKNPIVWHSSPAGSIAIISFWEVTLQ